MTKRKDVLEAIKVISNELPDSNRLIEYGLLPDNDQTPIIVNSIIDFINAKLKEDLVEDMDDWIEYLNN